MNAWGKHEAELRGFLTRQTTCVAQAEDILQETFLRTMTEGAKFCSLENPRAWLFQVARNQLIDQLRSYAAKNQASEATEDIPEEIDEIPAVTTLDACLPKALARLNKVDREAIERCDLEGQLQARFAEDKGLSLAGAKSRVQRARKRLKAELVELCKVNFDETGNVCCYTARDNGCC
ncbi:MAG TPA: sigma-70 family RNA polymerase sigma factor [Gammaproteobacteria bacterium]|nr:sigma-70 family RNA polymerase sigma factor [Gammaproteobacteria bacterium]